MIAIIAAVREELSELLKAYRFTEVAGPAQALAYRGETGMPAGRSADVLAVLSGVGRARAEEASNWLIRTHRPDWVVSTGFGGATADGIATGTLVLATAVTRLEGTPLEWRADRPCEPLSPDRALLARARRTVELAGIDFMQGPIVSVPIIARAPGLKRWLGEAFGVYSVDLESYWVARTARAAGVPFLAFRSVVDTAAMTLPEIVSDIPGAPTGKRFGAALAYSLRDPRRVIELERLRRAAAGASKQIAAFLTAFVGTPDAAPSASAGGSAA